MYGLRACGLDSEGVSRGSSGFYILHAVIYALVLFFTGLRHRGRQSFDFRTWGLALRVQDVLFSVSDLVARLWVSVLVFYNFKSRHSLAVLARVACFLRNCVLARLWNSLSHARRSSAHAPASTPNC